jgi:hypothetical protein
MGGSMATACIGFGAIDRPALLAASAQRSGAH